MTQVCRKDRIGVPDILTKRPATSVLDGIGNTPLVNVEGIWAKLEFLNPSGSIKARIARYMIEKAEKEGLLSPGDTIVEASSGNTGNALSMVAAVRGYLMLVVMPEGLVDKVVAISSEEALARMRRLAQKHGMFVGPSSGAHMVVAQRLRDARPELETVVTVFCDEGENCLNEHFRYPEDSAPNGGQT